MKCPFCISLLLCVVLGLFSCTGPVILEEPNDEPSVDGPTPEMPHERDSVPVTHEGTYASPYSVGEVLTLGRAKGVWVEGYVVGCVSGSMKSGCDFTAEATTASNILLADTFLVGDEHDYLSCVPVELPGGSMVRNDLNLYDNPDNYHRKVRIMGDVTLYFKVVGIRQVEKYVFADAEGVEPDDEDEEESDGDEDDSEDPKDPTDPTAPNDPTAPSDPDDPNATRHDTLSIAEGIALQSEREYNQVYIKGYIIGYTTSNRKVYHDLEEVKVSAKSNVVLADDPAETDCDKMIVVELKNGSYIQQAVNLYDHPDNLGKALTVKGHMYPYKDLHGCIDIPNGLHLPETGTVDEDYFFSIE